MSPFRCARVAAALVACMVALLTGGVVAAQTPYQVYVPALVVSHELIPAPGALTLRSHYVLPLSEGVVEVGGIVFNNTLEEYYDLVIRVVLRDVDGVEVGSATGRVLAHAAPSWGTAPFLFTVPVNGPASLLDVVPVSYRASAAQPQCWSKTLQLEQDWGDTTGRYTESGLVRNIGTQASYDIRMGYVVERADADSNWVLDRIVLAQLGKDELEPGEQTTYAIAFNRPSDSVALTPINTGRYRDIP